MLKKFFIGAVLVAFPLLAFAEMAPGLMFTKNIRVGSRDPEVVNLQWLLIRLGGDIYPEALTTGYFGVLTERAVKKAQQKYGIDPIGVVGPKTRAKLNELYREEVRTTHVYACPALIESVSDPAFSTIPTGGGYSEAKSVFHFPCTQDASASWRTFRAEDYGVEIKFPAHLIAVVNQRPVPGTWPGEAWKSNAVTLASFSKKDVGNTVAQLSVLSAKNFGFTSLDDVLFWLDDPVHRKNFKQKKMTINGREVVLDYETYAGGERNHTYYFYGKDFVYLLAVIPPDEGLGILQTMTFLKS